MQLFHSCLGRIRRVLTHSVYTKGGFRGYVWGDEKLGGLGQSPWSGGKGAKPPEADYILAIYTDIFTYN